MAYLIAAIVMTFSVLEGHFPIASFFKCDISYLWCAAQSSASAELVRITCKYLYTAYIFLVNRNFIVFVTAYLSEESVVTCQTSSDLFLMLLLCASFCIL